MQFLDAVLGVEVNEVFTCRGYYYRVSKLGTVLQVRAINGWMECAHPEVVAVYKEKDNIEHEDQEQFFEWR